MKYKNNRIKKLVLVLISLLLMLTSVFSGCSGGESYDNSSFKQADEDFSSVLNDPNFESLQESEKIEKIQNTLEQLSSEGIIQENSIKYDESNKLFTFTYSNGNLGGVSLKEFNDKVNSHSTKSTSSADEDNPELYYDNDDKLRAIVLNGFEDSSYRRDYYYDLDKDWDSKDLDTSVDISVTVQEMKKLNSFDVIVFAMHGSLYDEQPVLCLNQTVSAETDKIVKDDINSNLIAKVYYASDNEYHYWIMPEFFNYYYSQSPIDSKIIFSETCDFFGDDSISKNPDYQMADSLDEVSSGAIVGYHNSVGADYSRNIMKATVDNALKGYTINDALNQAKEQYGENDNYEDLSSNKYIAYPIITGDINSTLINIPVEDFSIQQDLILTIGEINVIEPSIEPENATDYSIRWTSSDESVVSVSPTGENGIITAKSKGTAVITAELNSNGKTISKSTTVRVATQGRDTVLVLDVSGSMSGTPIDEMKKSAINFCNELLADEYNNRVGIVLYDSDIYKIDLTNDLNYLISYIESIDSGSTTNMQGALAAAEDMLDNQGKSENIKNVVIMADGLPNEGETSDTGEMSQFTQYSNYPTDIAYANGVINQAESIMSKYNMYSLGFFHDLYDLEKDFATDLMKLLTNMSDGYHQVDTAENLQFAFGDIQETISDGSKIVINIACPVDVNVSYNGETLSSAADTYCDTASFGALQLLGKDKDIKVLSLNPGINYDVDLVGTGTGTMDYYINYIDETDNMVDYRNFESVPITPTTRINSNTDNTGDSIELNIDKDGDGEIDEIWSATVKGTATVSYTNENQESVIEDPVVENPVDESDDSWQTVLIVVLVVIVFGGVIFAVVFLSSTSNKKNSKINIPVANNTIEDKNYRKTESLNNNGKICVVNGPMNGKIFELDNEKDYTLGRDNNAQIVLSSEYSKVGRLHCIIMFDSNENCYYVTDLSTNGTFLSNGQRLAKDKKSKISRETTLTLADNDCKISLI